MGQIGQTIKNQSDASEKIGQKIGHPIGQIGQTDIKQCLTVEQSHDFALS